MYTFTFNVERRKFRKKQYKDCVSIKFIFVTSVIIPVQLIINFFVYVDLAQNLYHCETMNFFYIEQSLKFAITNYHAFITFFLQTMSFDIFPKILRDMSPRHKLFPDNFCKLVTKTIRHTSGLFPYFLSRDRILRNFNFFFRFFGRLSFSFLSKEISLSASSSDLNGWI